MSASIAKKRILINKKIDSRVEATWQNTLNGILLSFPDATLRAFSFLWSVVSFYLYIPTSLLLFRMALQLYSEAPFSPFVIAGSLVLAIIAFLLILHPIDIVIHGITIIIIAIFRKR